LISRSEAEIKLFLPLKEFRKYSVALYMFENIHELELFQAIIAFWWLTW